MPHALHKMGLPLGPLRHCGDDVAPQWQHGPHSSCLDFLRATCCCAASLCAAGASLRWTMITGLRLLGVRQAARGAGSAVRGAEVTEAEVV